MRGPVDWIRIQPSPWIRKLEAFTTGSFWTPSAEGCSRSIPQNHRAAIRLAIQRS